MTVLTDELRAKIKAALTTPPKRDPKPRPGVRRKTGSNWPYASDALGVNPDQIPEAVEYFRKAGVPTEFNEKGQAILTGPRHLHRHAKASGLFSGRDGYGFPNTSRHGLADAIRALIDE